MESNLLNKPKLLNNKHLEKKNEIQTKNFESSKLLIYRQRRQNLCYKLPKLPPRVASAATKKKVLLLVDLPSHFFPPLASLRVVAAFYNARQKIINRRRCCCENKKRDEPRRSDHTRPSNNAATPQNSVRVTENCRATRGRNCGGCRKQ